MKGDSYDRDRNPNVIELLIVGYVVAFLVAETQGKPCHSVITESKLVLFPEQARISAEIIGTDEDIQSKLTKKMKVYFFIFAREKN